MEHGGSLEKSKRLSPLLPLFIPSSTKAQSVHAYSIALEEVGAEELSHSRNQPILFHLPPDIFPSVSSNRLHSPVNFNNTNT